MTFQGYPRKDGRKGIRNTLIVAYLVECAHHVARAVVNAFPDDDVQLIGFPGCYPNAYADKMMKQICTHPNVGGVLLLSLGCESFKRDALEKHVRESGRPGHTLVIQQQGGTASTIEQGVAWVGAQLQLLEAMPRVGMEVSELIVGTICGGSDATSGLTGNPAAGRAFDKLIAGGAACIFEETGELIGLEQQLMARCERVELAEEVSGCITKAAIYYEKMGHGSFAPGNAEGGLTTIEEKSLGAYCKSGDSQIRGLIKPGDVPPEGGLYLLDVVPDGEPVFGFPNIVDNAEIVELIACGAHINLFVTGRGSVVGSAISPVIKICANPDTYEKLKEDMDINAGAILQGSQSLEQVGQAIYDLVLAVASGQATRSEELGHREFILGYKTFEPIGPSCLPR